MGGGLDGYEKGNRLGDRKNNNIYEYPLDII
jgi:hypothetical protein